MARIYGILAPKANKVVLFRRGPSRLTLQLVWDLSTDEVIPGQWIKGNVQVYRCDVSPDCRYLVGAYTNYTLSRRNLKPDPRCSTEGWTAISRPPFYSALALYYKKGAYGGGGIWDSSTEVRLENTATTWVEAIPVGGSVRATLLSKEGFGTLVERLLWEKRGWTEVQTTEVCYQALGLQKGRIPRPMQKILPNGKARMCCEDGCKFQLIDLKQVVHREWPAARDEPFWLEAAANGDLVFSEHGCLWRWRSFPHGEPELVADLNGMKFKPLAPPEWALEW